MCRKALFVVQDAGADKPEQEAFDGVHRDIAVREARDRCDEGVDRLGLAGDAVEPGELADGEGDIADIA